MLCDRWRDLLHYSLLITVINCQFLSFQASRHPTAPQEGRVELPGRSSHSGRGKEMKLIIKCSFTH